MKRPSFDRQKKTVTGGQREASVMRRIYFQHGR